MIQDSPVCGLQDGVLPEVVAEHLLEEADHRAQRGRHPVVLRAEKWNEWNEVTYSYFKTLFGGMNKPLQSTFGPYGIWQNFINSVTLTSYLSEYKITLTLHPILCGFQKSAVTQLN